MNKLVPFRARSSWHWPPRRGLNSSPNAAGVAMGHLHYHVKDVDANRKF
jgi:hypothetical protein